MNKRNTGVATKHAFRRFVPVGPSGFTGTGRCFLEVSREALLKNWKQATKASGDNGSELVLVSFSWPAAEGFQHPSGQFPTQTESLVYGHGTGCSPWRERSTLDERGGVEHVETKLVIGDREGRYPAVNAILVAGCWRGGRSCLSTVKSVCTDESLATSMRVCLKIIPLWYSEWNELEIVYG